MTPMHLEIVSHCWHYSRLLTYQLSSLVLHPPTEVAVTVTVFLAEEDEDTVFTLVFSVEIGIPLAMKL